MLLTLHTWKRRLVPQHVFPNKGYTYYFKLLINLITSFLIY